MSLVRFLAAPARSGGRVTDIFRLAGYSPSGPAVRASYARWTTASQRRDFDSPSGISGATALASVATSLWQGPSIIAHGKPSGRKPSGIAASARFFSYCP